ncbi:glucosamine-6-phosphate deaminase [candidate division KSB1 bacterium]|nr:glucosamine-6-phosphate deaminase [candidate division KSB1 bacterium]
MLVFIQKNYEEISKAAARVVSETLYEKPTSVLGMATGGTPLGLYKELIRLHKEGLDFSKVTTFNLDEYIGLPPSHPQSYHYFMYENLFKHINLDERYIHIPSGMVDMNDLDKIHQYCEWYEQQITAAGGIDLQILGIGANGHIGFNEPGSSLGSRTRIKTLTLSTKQDNARFFENEITKIPKYAITMGIGTILDSKKILLLASGKNKAKAIKDTVEGPITAQVPASIVQMHRKAILIVDEDAASLLDNEYEEIVTNLE